MLFFYYISQKCCFQEIKQMLVSIYKIPFFNRIYLLLLIKKIRKMLSKIYVYEKREKDNFVGLFVFMRMAKIYMKRS